MHWAFVTIDFDYSQSNDHKFHPIERVWFWKIFISSSQFLKLGQKFIDKHDKLSKMDWVILWKIEQIISEPEHIPYTSDRKSWILTQMNITGT